jgi:hypothetical protein
MAVLPSRACGRVQGGHELVGGVVAGIEAEDADGQATVAAEPADQVAAGRAPRVAVAGVTRDGRHDQPLAAGAGQLEQREIGPMPAVLGQPGAGVHQLGGWERLSRVNSATARLAQASSTRSLFSAAAAMRAARARLLRERGRPLAAWWRRATASSANRGWVRPATASWCLRYYSALVVMPTDVRETVFVEFVRTERPAGDIGIISAA